MISTETGVYVQFFDDGESADKSLPPLGPFELLIVRHNRIIGDREQVEHDAHDMTAHGSVERWLEAELELRRALGDEPGGARRNHMRIRAPRGDIIVRFYDYTGDEPPKVPELGPFYALTVGKREVRADDKLLAIRSTDMSPWTLTDQVRPGIAGINKSDFSVFSLSARDPVATTVTAPAVAPQIAPPPAPPVIAAPSGRIEPAAPPVPIVATEVAPEVAPGLAAENGAPGSEPAPRIEFTERRKIQREIYVARPLPQDEKLTPADVNLILRVDKLKQQELAQQLMVERLRREQRVDPEAALRTEAVASLPMRFQPPVKERAAPVELDDEVEYEPESFTASTLGFLWRFRIFIVTGFVLLALVSAYGYLQPRVTTPSAVPLTFAGVGERIQTPDWTYAVISVERTTSIAGTPPPASGGFLIVHITATRKNLDAPPLDPIAFTLIDANGARALAFPATSDLYASSSGLLWATRYPVGTLVHDQVAFDINPTVKDLIFLIKPANVEVRLPNP
jgi:hypothetical protein